MEVVERKAKNMGLFVDFIGFKASFGFRELPGLLVTILIGRKRNQFSVLNMI